MKMELSAAPLACRHGDDDRFRFSASRCRPRRCPATGGVNNFPASATDCDGGASRPKRIRVGRSAAQNAGHTESAAKECGETPRWLAQKLPGFAKVALLRRQQHARSRHPDRTICLRTTRMPGQFQLAQGVRIRQSNSQVHAERLCNLQQAFSLVGMAVAPGGAACAGRGSRR